MTDGEAEFAGLDQDSSADLFEQALMEYGKLDCGSPMGFVPPTWHGNDHLVGHCLEHGITYCETRFHIWHLKHIPQRVFNFPLSMFSNTESMLKKSASVSGFLTKNMANLSMRMVFHPVDFESKEKTDVMGALVEVLQETRIPCCYGDWLQNSE